MVKYSATSRRVVGSSPTWGAKPSFARNKGLPRSQTAMLCVFRFESTLGPRQQTRLGSKLQPELDSGNSIATISRTCRCSSGISLIAAS